MNTVMKKLEAKLKNVQPMSVDQLVKMTPEKIYKFNNIKKLFALYLGLCKELNCIQDRRKTHKATFDDDMNYGQFNGTLFSVQIRLNDFIKKEEAKAVYALTKNSVDKKLSEAVRNYFDMYEFKKKKKEKK